MQAKDGFANVRKQYHLLQQPVAATGHAESPAANKGLGAGHTFTGGGSDGGRIGSVAAYAESGHGTAILNEDRGIDRTAILNHTVDGL